MMILKTYYVLIVNLIPNFKHLFIIFFYYSRVKTSFKKILDARLDKIAMVCINYIGLIDNLRIEIFKFIPRTL